MSPHLLGRLLVKRLDLMNDEHLVLQQILELEQMIVHQIVVVDVTLDLGLLAVGLPLERQQTELVAGFEKQPTFFVAGRRKDHFRAVVDRVLFGPLFHGLDRVAFGARPPEQPAIEVDHELVYFVGRDFLHYVGEDFVEIQEDAGLIGEEAA